LGLKINYTQAGTFEVGAEHLVALTEIKDVLLNARGKVSKGKELVLVGIAIILTNCNEVSFWEEV